MAPVVGEQRAARGGVGRGLQPAVHGRRDAIPLGERGIAEPLDHFEASHLGDVRRVELDDRPVDARLDRHRVCRSALGLADLAGFDHAPQHVGPPLARATDARHRIVERRRARQSRDQRRLGERELRRPLVEVHLRRRSHPVGALAEEDPVQVQGEDLLLAELAFEPAREEHLLELAAQRTFVGQHGVACELHGDGAAALAYAAGGDVADRSTHQALPVHAGMLEEAVVFRREERVHQQRRNLFPGHGNAPLLADLRDQPAVARVHGERHLRADLAQFGRVGNLGLEELVRAREAEDDEAGERQRNRDHRHEQSRHEKTRAQICDPVLAAPAALVHSSSRIKGKLIER